MSEALFNDFEKVSPEQWAEKLNKDLKDKSIDSLMWKTQGLSGKPFYTAQDLDKQSYNYSNIPQKPELFGSRFWVNYQTIQVKEGQSANQKAIFALEHGANGIIFELDKNTSLITLLKGIQPKHCHLGFKLSEKVNYEAFEESLSSFFTSNHVNTSDVNGFIEAETQKSSLAYLKTEVVQLSNSDDLCLSLAKDLAKLIDQIDQLSKNTTDVQAFFSKSLFVLNTQNDFFLEISRHRATRRLIETLLAGYNIKNEKVEILSKIGPWTEKIDDPHSFMLHATTQCMSAILGGTDAVSVLPFHNIFEGKSNLAERVARNISSILSEESYLSKMTDPAQGSYYIERMTEDIYTKTFKIIEDIEAKGGYSKTDVSKLKELKE